MNDEVYTDYGVVNEESMCFKEGDILYLDREEESFDIYWARKANDKKDNKHRAIVKHRVTRIPKYFLAYVKDDTWYHRHDGETVEMTFEEYDEDKDMLFFTHDGLYIPHRDIDLSTISLSSPNVTIKSNIPTIHSMPTMADLDGCTIHVDGREITVTKESSNLMASATCHPDDEPDFGTGLSIAYDRLKKEVEGNKEIKVGDEVKVTNPGSNYSGAITTVSEIIEDKELIAKFAYGDYLTNSSDRNGVFIVRYINDEYAYIEHETNGRCRLINVDGIEKYVKERDDVNWLF